MFLHWHKNCKITVSLRCSENLTITQPFVTIATDSRIKQGQIVMLQYLTFAGQNKWTGDHDCKPTSVFENLFLSLLNISEKKQHHGKRVKVNYVHNIHTYVREVGTKKKVLSLSYLHIHIYIDTLNWLLTCFFRCQFQFGLETWVFEGTPCISTQKYGQEKIPKYIKKVL